MALVLLFVSLVNGFVVSVNLGVNGILSEASGSPLAVACLSCIAASCLEAALSVILPKITPIPPSRELRSIPIWDWVGGAVSAYTFVAGIVGTFRVGIAITSLVIMVGHIATSAIICGVRALTGIQILGFCFVLFGSLIAMMQKHDWTQASAFSRQPYVHVVMLLLAGACVPFLAIMNGRLSESLGHPLRAAWVSDAVAAFVLFCACACLSDVHALPVAGSAPGLVLLSATCTSLFTCILIVVPKRVGICAYSCIYIVGEQVSGLLMDATGVFSLQVSPTPVRILGVTLASVGAMLFHVKTLSTRHKVSLSLVGMLFAISLQWHGTLIAESMLTTGAVSQVGMANNANELWIRAKRAGAKHSVYEYRGQDSLADENEGDAQRSLHNNSVYDLREGFVVKEFMRRALTKVTKTRIVILSRYSVWEPLVKGFGHVVASDFGNATWALLLIADGSPDSLLKCETHLESKTVTYIVLSYNGYEDREARFAALNMLWKLRYHVQIMASTIDLGIEFVPNTLITSETWSSFVDAAKLGTVLLFATQGFDLAIPTATTFAGLRCPKFRTNSRGSDIYQTSPPNLSVAWSPSGDDFSVSCREEGNTSTTHTPATIIETWSSRRNISRSEALCVRASCGREPRVGVRCITRVLPVRARWDSAQKAFHTRSSKPNLLMVMIDPMSYEEMQRSLVQTKRMLQTSGFYEFVNYAVVGANSGPNQAALYSGHNMSIPGNLSSVRASWLWDDLRNAGYKTMKVEDACIRNSNMVQSLEPRTTHGSHLRHLFCFDWSRPNCLGEKLASSHALDYATQFISAYEGVEDSPWASFVHLVDSHEDSQSLGAVLDGPLMNFLTSLRKLQKNTVIVLLSDHGMHYGPYFQTIAGQREHRHPFLHLSIPPALRKIPSGNLLKRVVPFDVHDAILHLTLGRGEGRLFRALPKHRSCSELGIPADFCDFNEAIPRSCLRLRVPPAALSFYADIARSRAHVRQCPLGSYYSFVQENLSIGFNSARPKCGPRACQCATAASRWQKCAGFQRHETDDFILVDCCGRADIHVGVQRQPALVQRFHHIRPRLPLSWDAYGLPNILIIQLDSVSRQFAERHLPHTWSVLNNLSSSTSSPHVRVDLELMSVIGPTSVPNQLALLTGCTWSAKKMFGDGTKTPLPWFRDFRKVECDSYGCIWCPRGHKASSKDDLEWLFQDAQGLGYVTFMGNEICTNSSLFSAKRGTWNLGTFRPRLDKSLDHLFDTLYCRAYERFPHVIEDLNCNSGEFMSLHLLRALSTFWDAYSDVPKFSFVDFKAAHNYSLDLSQSLLAVESLDVEISGFLKKVLGRPDSANSLILLGSDHGLQQSPKLREHAMQMEHIMPWMQVIFPRRLHSARVAQNGKSIVTPFDLYRTIRSYLGVEPKAGQPHGFDLLLESIPSQRSCSDAAIPPDFCPCENEFLSKTSNVMDCPYAPKEANCNVLNPFCCRAWMRHQKIAGKCKESLR
eukprot:TRINITY_DN20627_c0_g1_i1.p1 TRINITY_DN20627_c0_g1~~TRINITY_DN20627_c0_g1_i1.p1  ORF type:complete len:1488 (+),score=79.68 TRINITY_DN20627_c0_g1_i1:36-4466(+)